MTKQLALVVATVLSLALAGCGDGANDPDAGVGFDAASTIDAEGGGDDAATPDGSPAIDADLTAPDADPTAPDADLTAPDAALVSSDLRINEILLDLFGSDSDEFIEIVGTPSTDYSAFTLLEVDGDYFNDGSGRGRILTTIAVGTTDANGYWVTSVANNSFQNGSSTILLVRGSTAVETHDLDADNDGAIDVTPPWAELIDAVAIFDNVPSTDNQDLTYAGDSVLTKTATATQPLSFGGASRIPDGTDTDSASDWTSNTPHFDNAGIASGEALNTPGAINAVQP